MSNPKTFEENLSQLEKIIASLEENETSLEENIKQFEEGMSLIKACHGQLSQAETTVTNLLKKSN